jgi:hypothetical protein
MFSIWTFEKNANKELLETTSLIKKNMIAKQNGRRKTLIILPIDRETQIENKPPPPIEKRWGPIIGELNSTQTKSNAFLQIKRYPKLRKYFPDTACIIDISNIKIY